MRPAFLDAMSWEMAEVYGAITDQILVNLAHYFQYWKRGQPVPKSTFEYQANMLAQMGKVNQESIRIIANGLGGANDVLQRILEQAIIESVEKAEPQLLTAVKEGLLQTPYVVPVAPNQMRAFQLYYKQAADKLNLVNTVMLESTQQAYQATVSDIAARVQATQTALDIGAGETATGVSTWNQALRHSIDRMKAGGITGFIDHAGRHWSAEAYVAMDIRTTVANTARAATWETNENFGNDLYQVSYHNGARPLCYPWQTKVISSTDNARTVVDLDGNEIQVYAQSETSYGQAAGLFGINCKHFPTPFIPGVSVIRGQPQNEEANAKAYAESQQQRAMERKLREEKRDLMMLKAQGAPEDVISAQRAKCRATSAEIQDFCDSTGRARHRDREGVYTERKFPAADTYDVAAFERKQKEMIDGFYSEGGAQQSYSFGQMQPNVVEVHADIEQFRTAAIGAENKFDFWMNLTEEQQAAFKSSGLSIDELYEMVKTDAPISEWKMANPGGAENFAIKYDYTGKSISFVEERAKSEGWMAEAGAPGIVRIRDDGGIGENWEVIITHEMGHQLTAYNKELADIVMYNPGDVLGRYNIKKMGFYGISYSPEESFAQSVAYYVVHPETLKRQFPKAYDAVDELFKSSPSALEFVKRGVAEYKRKFIK